MPDHDRAQAYTLEGLIAAIILASSLLYGLQAVDVAPWSGGTDDLQTEGLQTQARDVLARAAANGTLRQAVTCVDADGKPDGNIGKNSNNVTALGGWLDRAFSDYGRDFQIYFQYWEEHGDVHSPSGWRLNRTMVHPVRDNDPDPSDLPTVPDENAATATYRVVLFDDTPLRTSDGDSCQVGDNTGTFGSPTAETSDSPHESDDLYVSDVAENKDFYNVVEVRLVVWNQ